MHDHATSKSAGSPSRSRKCPSSRPSSAARNTAANNSKIFRTVGERKAFTDKFNALRKATLGKLLEMPHKITSEALPSDFAEKLHQTALEKEQTEAAKKLTREEKRAELEAARKDAAERAKRVKELEAELDKE